MKNETRKTWTVISIPSGNDYTWYAYNRITEEAVKCENQEAAANVVRELS